MHADRARILAAEHARHAEAAIIAANEAYAAAETLHEVASWRAEHHRHIAAAEATLAQAYATLATCR